MIFAAAIEVECRDIFSSPQNDAIQRGIIDVGFLRPPVDQMNLDCELLFEEEFVVVLSRSHRLARRRSVKLKDVAQEPLILFDRSFSSGLYDKIMGLYSRQGFSPHLTITHVEAHEEAGAIMVASGKGIFMGAGAIVNRSVAGVQLASVRLNEPEAKIEVYAAWRRDDDARALHDFLDCMRREMRGKAGRPPFF